MLQHDDYDPPHPSDSLHRLQHMLFDQYKRMPSFGKWQRIVARYNERKKELGWFDAPRQTIQAAIHSLSRDQVFRFFDILGMQAMAEMAVAENISTFNMQEDLYTSGYLRDPELPVWRTVFPNAAEHFAADDPGSWMERLTGVYSHVARP